MSSEFEVYLFDKRSNTFVKLKPDYSNRVPIVTAEGAAGASRRKELKGAKADDNLGVIVPLTKKRPNSSDYAQFATIVRKYPRIDAIGVINPTLDRRGVGVDGPGADPEYQNAIKYLQANGARVIGYIATGGALKSVEDCKREIDKWKEWYPEVNGVFFDEMSVSSANAQYYKELNDHAKKLGMQLTVGDMAHTHKVGEAVADSETYFANTGIDIFIVYENRGYPNESWYAAYKQKSWLSSYPRSRFAWLVFGVSDNDVLASNNFVDRVVGIENLAGYVYVQPELGVPNDQRGFPDWDTISPYLQSVMIALERYANQQRMPFKKGVFPDQAKVVDDSGGAVVGRDVRHIPQGPPDEDKSVIAEGAAVAPPQIEKDTLGIVKIYPSAQEGGFEWQSENLDPEKKQSMSDMRVIEVSATPKLLNQEITGYFKFKGETLAENVVKIHTRTGSKVFGESRPENPDAVFCESSGYMGILNNDGSVHVKKQVNAESITGKRAITQLTNESLSGRWIGLKFMVYNFQAFDPKNRSESTGVRMEFYVDDNVTDENKELVVKNSWRKIMVTSDEGGWIAKSGSKSKTKGSKKKTGEENTNQVIDECVSLDASKPKDTKGRENDELITLAGGSEESNCVIFEFAQDSDVDFRYLSAREINVAHRD